MPAKPDPSDSASTSAAGAAEAAAAIAAAETATRVTTQTRAAGDGTTPQHTGGPAQVPATALAWIDNDDLNGECFIAGEVGEVEKFENFRVVGFYKNTPAATTPLEIVPFTVSETSGFIALNARMVAAAKNQTLALVHVKIAYVRFLAARAGLISPNFDKASHHVKYNEAEFIDQADLDIANTAGTEAAVGAIEFTTGARKLLRENFANMVCAVAYMFRVRGHHFLGEMDNKYQALWKKCLKDDGNPGLEWSVIAHDCLHAIMPDVLDDYWKACVASSQIAGALIKRFDSAPAGVAAVRAVYTGAQDLQMAVPGIRERFIKHFDDLDNIMAQLRLERWAGSINRRYYGAKAVDFDEQKFGAIAAVIYHALKSFSAESMLLRSNALIRVANNAPITGGIVGRSIATAAADPELVKTMLNIRRT